MALSITVLEVGLRIFDSFDSPNQSLQRVEDPVLGIRVRPGSPGHDSNGYRNESVPEAPEIVVLGDSQTWGVNVESKEAWPKALQNLSGKSVYNMGVGGYGPLQYASQTQEALTLKPRVLIVGLYLGNDIYDAYSFAYLLNAYKDLRLANTEGLLPDTISQKTDAIWNDEKNFEQSWRFAPLTFGDWLQGHSAIGRHLAKRGLWPGESDFWHRAAIAWATEHPNDGVFVQTPPIQTVFTVSYRLEGVNLDEPRIKEGLRITKLALKKIRDQVERSDTKLLILLIPTKESVYSEIVYTNQNPISQNYRNLIEMESKIRDDIKAFCIEENLIAEDALPKLSSVIADGQPIYPTTTESHPNAHGYHVLGELVFEKLEKLGWLE